jgi:uncharacterized protein (DUF1501 family)
MSLDRRTFLKSAGLGTAGLVLGAPRLCAGEPDTGPDTILVVVQLSGGNDGLSTVVPHADPAYHRARRQTAIEDVIEVGDHAGLHPNLDGLARLFGEGRLAIVQGVGYPEPQRSHFKSMDIWHTGDLRGRRRDTGWVGRAIDECCGGSAESNLVVNIGNELPYALHAHRHKAVSFQQPQSYRWQGSAQVEEDFAALNRAREGESAVDWLHRQAAAARASSAEVRRAAAGYQTSTAYPTQPLGRDLRTVAGLIDGGLRTRVYYTSLGGFDTHVRQKNSHDNLMRALGDSLTAFQADLEAHGHADRVVTMVFSEFGRRVEENASGGTDHGTAGCMFVLGTKVRGGWHGRYPSLDELDGNGDLVMTTDFRGIYAALLDEWLGVDSKAVLGKRFQRPELIEVG